MYGEDLAYIHDQGYSSGTKQAAPFIVRMLQSRDLRYGRIFNIGCGTGHSTAVFAKAGYDVIGVDRSPAMVRFAKRRTPRGTFMTASSLMSIKTPSDLIVAIGDVFNYLPSRQALQDMIRGTFETLRPDGYLVFDIRTPPPPGGLQGWSNGRTGKDWAVIATSCVAPNKQRLTRTITIFRKVRGKRRRGKETHRQQLYQPVEIHHWLRSKGFRMQVRCGYGRTQICPGGKVFISRKPLTS